MSTKPHYPENVPSAKKGATEGLAARSGAGAGDTTVYGRCRACYAPQHLIRLPYTQIKNHDFPYEACQCGCADFWDLKEYAFKPRRRSFKHRARRFNQRYGVALCISAAIFSLAHLVLLDLKLSSLGYEAGAAFLIALGGFMFGALAAQSHYSGS